MNVIFISPHFPHTYWGFCDGLKKNGCTVLGIADAPYDQLSPELKSSLTEYYRVDSMEDYNQMYKAVAYFAFKYGKIDWIESNNEYWLEQDARLRTDFNVTTGIKSDRIKSIKEKSEMKKYYAKGGIPSAKQIKAKKGLKAVLKFAVENDYPLIAKPDVGVGANETFKLHNDEETKNFFETVASWESYVIEEFVTGDLVSYEAIVNSKGEPIFESTTEWPPSIMDIVNKKLDFSYRVPIDVPEDIKEVGRRTFKAFGITNRFVHLEFFRLDRDRRGLGKKGDYVGLEVNMRPPGGYTPDMINWAHSIDVKKVWADMVAFDESRTEMGEQFYCVYASRRDFNNYAHSIEDVAAKYGSAVLMNERAPEILSAAMGNHLFTAKFKTSEEVDEFVAYVHEHVKE